MVIQANMSPQAIVEIWDVTFKIFEQYQIPQTSETLETLVDGDTLSILLEELNAAVGSSAVTCVAGG